VIRADDVQFLHPTEPVEKPPEPLLSLREAERVHVQRVLEEVAWNKQQAAKILEISRGTLYRKIGEYDLQPRQSGPKLTPAEHSSTG
jgi:DNA-binding NtrC family response regulator